MFTGSFYTIIACVNIIPIFTMFSLVSANAFPKTPPNTPPKPPAMTGSESPKTPQPGTPQLLVIPVLDQDKISHEKSTHLRNVTNVRGLTRRSLTSITDWSSTLALPQEDRSELTPTVSKPPVNESRPLKRQKWFKIPAEVSSSGPSCAVSPLKPDE